MIRALVAAAGLALALAPAADAAWVPKPPKGSYTFHRAPCPDHEVPQYTAGCVTGDERAWHVWAPNQDWAAADRELVLHELAHVVDFVLLDDVERAAFMDIMRYPRPALFDWETWALHRVGTLGSTDFPGTPNELFASAYSWCGLTGRYRHRLDFRWGRRGRLVGAAYEWRPTRAQARQVCRLIRSVEGGVQ